MTSIKPERWFFLIWLAVTLWLLACALIVQGEYGDGYQTIVNARYLFGDSPNYYVQRGPLAAIALWPVDFIVKVLDIDPIDVRPYHLFSAIVHSAYLVLGWLFLRRAPGSVEARLIAFVAAILSVIFYAYAPFLSHDILPGILFLLMIFLSHRWLEKRQTGDAVFLVLLGGAVTLVKQTYAIFWVAIMVYAIAAWMLKWQSERVSLRALVTLGAFAASSAVISWLSYAWFIGGELPNSPLLTRPMKLVEAISGQYGEAHTNIFATDLYLRNLPNYGIAAMLLVAPGLYLALRGADARMRQIAVCWLVSACIMQLIGFREARYLGFLAPLTAMLLVPVVQLFLRRQVAVAALLLLVLFDQSRGIRAGLKPLSSAAGVNVMRFINSAGDQPDIVTSNVLSFALVANSPLPRDRYHGIFHLTPELLNGLYEGQVSVSTITDPKDQVESEIQPGDRVYFSNNTLVRGPPWPEKNQPAELADFLLVAGQAVTLDLQRRGDNLHRSDDDGTYVMYLPLPGTSGQMPVLTSGPLSLSAAANLVGDEIAGERLEILGVSVTALCRADTCSYR